MNKKFVTNNGEDSVGKYFKEVRKSQLLNQAICYFIIMTTVK